MTSAQDRAAIVARAVLQIVVRHILDDGIAVHQQLTDYLRDEFSETSCVHSTINEIRESE